MSDFRFTLHHENVKDKLDKNAEKWLLKSSELILDSVRENTAVKSGKTRSGWEKNVDMDTHRAIIGNKMKNAVWEEFGTGEYAISGNGRKGGWCYRTTDGKFYFTKGKMPKRAFRKAYLKNKRKIVYMAGEIFGSEK